MRTDKLPHETPNPWVSTEQLKSELKELHPAFMMSVQEISEIFGVPRSLVRQYMHSKPLREHILKAGKGGRLYVHRDDWAVFWIEIRPRFV